jgi:hypothetical protein
MENNFTHSKEIFEYQATTRRTRNAIQCYTRVTCITSIMSSDFRENNNNRIHAITAALMCVVLYTLYFPIKVQIDLADKTSICLTKSVYCKSNTATPNKTYLPEILANFVKRKSQLDHIISRGSTSHLLYLSYMYSYYYHQTLNWTQVQLLLNTPVKLVSKLSFGDNVQDM